MDKQQIAERFNRLRKMAKANREVSPTVESVEELVDEVFGNGIIDVKIEIPLKKNGRDFFNLNEKILLQAERENKLIRLTASDGGRLVEPAEWRRGAVITFQRFKFDTPMKMYGNFIFKD